MHKPTPLDRQALLRLLLYLKGISFSLSSLSLSFTLFLPLFSSFLPRFSEIQVGDPKHTVTALLPSQFFFEFYFIARKK
jgi:hypothetical protein